jgi:hypothetical protein
MGIVKIITPGRIVINCKSAFLSLQASPPSSLRPVNCCPISDLEGGNELSDSLHYGQTACNQPLQDLSRYRTLTSQFPACCFVCVVPDALGHPRCMKGYKLYLTSGSGLRHPPLERVLGYRLIQISLSQSTGRAASTPQLSLPLYWLACVSVCTESHIWRHASATSTDWNTFGSTLFGIHF